MKSNIIHIVVRIVILILSWILALPIAYSYLDYTAPDRRCGTADLGLIFFLIILFSFLWFVAMIIEAIILNKKKKIVKRNINLIIMGYLTMLFIILFL
ncbi:hypothetical protein PG614_06470 [Riemerella anatipestifer]|nr:hypothetical protein [Riemerella anatipestifer]MDY3533114.1 hypothetical protein [Riemerella anatipestifer]MDY3535587.1 hypothetical protein [Riemerella anatipestifer]